MRHHRRTVVAEGGHPEALRHGLRRGAELLVHRLRGDRSRGVGRCARACAKERSRVRVRVRLRARVRVQGEGEGGLVGEGEGEGWGGANGPARRRGLALR